MNKYLKYALSGLVSGVIYTTITIVIDKIWYEMKLPISYIIGFILFSLVFALIQPLFERNFNKVIKKKKVEEIKESNTGE